jgi:hypothetical protein
VPLFLQEIASVGANIACSTGYKNLCQAPISLADGANR